MAIAAAGAAQHAVRRPVDGRPAAIVDLRTAAGARLVDAQWRYRDTELVRAQFNGPGPDLRPSGPPLSTYDYAPRAGAADFDDSRWDAIDPEALEARRCSGRICFGWYRTTITVPDRVGRFETAGATIVFEAVVDDYAEVWIDGRLPRTLGQAGGSLVGGFNARNRVVLTHDARPGQRIAIAVFAANGPLSDPPPNFVWVRSATLDFHPPGSLRGPSSPVRVDRRDPALDAIVPDGVTVEQLAGGFLFTEGPVWDPDGSLLFSDPNANTIYRWSDVDGLSVFRTKSGYSGTDVGEFTQPGSNGLALDREGRLTINEHGNRRVTRLEKNGQLTVLADRFEGRRLNSPNDLVYRSDGALYFTDPPFGLPMFGNDPRRETPHSGIYRVWNGRVQLVGTELTGPNGLAFSPDEKHLYVGNWDEGRKVVLKYDVQPDGTLANARVFFDMTPAPGHEAIDGVKVDREGHVYVSGPGGLWILSPDGRHLGTLITPEHPHNFAWGDEDGRTLYLAAQTGLYRLRLRIPGAGTSAPPAMTARNRR